MAALSDLFTDARSGRLSHTKLWGNVASLVATVMFVRQGEAGRLTADIWFAYLGTLGGYVAVLRGISTWRDVAGASNKPEESQ